MSVVGVERPQRIASEPWRLVRRGTGRWRPQRASTREEGLHRELRPQLRLRRDRHLPSHLVPDPSPPKRNAPQTTSDEPLHANADKSTQSSPANANAKVSTSPTDRRVPRARASTQVLLQRSTKRSCRLWERALQKYSKPWRRHRHLLPRRTLLVDVLLAQVLVVVRLALLRLQQLLLRAPRNITRSWRRQGERFVPSAT